MRSSKKGPSWREQFKHRKNKTATTPLIRFTTPCVKEINMESAKKRVTWRDQFRHRKNKTATSLIRFTIPNSEASAADVEGHGQHLDQEYYDGEEGDLLPLEDFEPDNYIERNEVEINIEEAEMVPGNYGPEIYMEYDEEEKIINNEGMELAIGVEYSDENAQIVVQRRGLNELLYDQAKISLNEGMMLIEWLRSRHNFSDAAFADILRVLKKGLLPSNNRLPCDPRTFLKLYSRNSPIEIYYKTSDFVIFNIEKQLREIVERNYSNIIEHKRILYSSQFYDECGDLYRARAFNTINLSLYTDGGQIAKSAKYSVWPIIATIRDLPPKLEKSIKNTIWLVRQGQPDWTIIFTPIIEQIKKLEKEQITFEIKTNSKYSVQSAPFEVAFVEFLADSMARKSLISINGPTGRYSCPICLIEGVYVEELGAIKFPHDTPAPKRKTWRAGKDPGLNKKKTPLDEFMQLPQCTGLDVMHSTYSGMFKFMFQALYSPTCNKQFLDSLEWNFIKPIEIKRNMRPFNAASLFKSNEWRLLCVYFAPILLQELRNLIDRRNSRRQKDNEKKLVNMLLLCAAMNILSSKYLTKERIKFSHRLLNKWHATLANAYDPRFERFLAHVHMHYADLSIAHGSVAFRSCFTGESAVGFIGERVHSRENALIQMTNRLIKWKQACTNKDYDDDLDGFINKLLKNTGHGQSKNSQIDLDKIEFDDKPLLRNHFRGKKIYVVPQIKLDYFTIKSSDISHGINDSIIYMESILEGKDSLKPFLVKLVISVEDTIYFVLQIMDIAMPLSKTLRWVNDVPTRRLLTDKSLSLANVIERLEMADLYQAKSLYSSCGQWIRRNLKMVKEEAKWMELKKKSPELVIAILEEFAEELEDWNWLHNSHRRTRILQQFLEEVENGREWSAQSSSPPSRNSSSN